MDPRVLTALRVAQQLRANGLCHGTITWVAADTQGRIVARTADGPPLSSLPALRWVVMVTEAESVLMDPESGTVTVYSARPDATVPIRHLRAPRGTRSGERWSFASRYYAAPAQKHPVQVGGRLIWARDAEELEVSAEFGRGIEARYIAHAPFV